MVSPGMLPFSIFIGRATPDRAGVVPTMRGSASRLAPPGSGSNERAIGASHSDMGVLYRQSGLGPP